MSAWFELKQYGSGACRFLLKTKEAQTMLQSDRYPCRDSAEAALGLFRAHCASPERYVKKISSGGKPFFKLKSGKEVILVSHLYDSEATLESAISAIASAGTTERVEHIQL
ncbi:DUF1508 domain-containing protein [Pseudomonas protegens]|jgi:uncharacterized protein YegP (UPF0339 family)|uniref:DUF1508 domain-containing protein n=3 Tax=Pseudomonas protegens TaxID=380021 RepID=Q4K9Q4_PSEF5|nr:MULTISPECIES: YegP family protein [Pseudomonas]BCQ63359.1 hypothetical protein PBOI14_51090 [Pseudomonas sp. Boi14]GED77921.1 hypothetical protein PFL02_47710 [Pseudomonas fluorescens]AAY93193.1 conserved hypothetical protein [Pseudomonas protegens Pf-5]AGL85754.1 hypothetical protein PFLCHA0_c39880 [Pseudomonas protegens CHA0]AQT10876.1 yegp protein [Pseudomonas protegens]